ncbi:uncharacterized protein LOC116203319 isoform X2 [Punica granatum]|uniref:Uncharacterized protein LOC116203319 isoform X2 n=1 Tax=Punica granatum TaxID=22663 RepID=A0A6P8D386_PUNGR|nr:uncharacterized protein LOC116203319 isoform X2 [Punica granatum]
MNKSRCYEGDRLGLLLRSIHEKIEAARASDGDVLPEKIWLKQQFAIGVNEVTRLLERMPLSGEKGSSPQKPDAMSSNDKAPWLQAVLVAFDCNPKWLIRHLPSLASSRKVPLIFVKDKKRGSLRLGEIVKLKTAMAIGIKAKGSAINAIVEKILGSDKLDDKKVHSEPKEILREPQQHSLSVQT